MTPVDEGTPPGRRTDRLYLTREEAVELRQAVADQREWVTQQMARMQRELDLVRSSVQTISTMVGELLAALARRD